METIINNLSRHVPYPSAPSDEEDYMMALAIENNTTGGDMESDTDSDTEYGEDGPKSVQGDDEYTNNGALAHKTTNAILEFFIALRRCPSKNREEKDKHLANMVSLMEKSASQDLKKTLQVIFHARDPRNGKGERDIPLDMLYQFKKRWPRTYTENAFDFFNVYGCWKDAVKIGERFEITCLAKALTKDMELLNASSHEHEPRISLAAKWAPTEKGAFACAAKTLANTLFPECSDKLKKYRQMLSMLRSAINIVEKKMCANQWNEIDYSAVPAKASKLYANAFTKHDEEKRYQEYITSLKEGKEKVNVAGLQVYNLVEATKSTPEVNAIADAQFQEILKDLRNSGTLDNAIPVVDVSGSMSCSAGPRVTCMDISISLGILTSQLCTGPYSKHMITFSGMPELVHIEGSTLKELVTRTSQINWGFNTNIQCVFQRILDFASDVPEEYRREDGMLDAKYMPKKVLIFSDMQFDNAFSDIHDSPWDTIKKMYEEKGYTAPQVVFWDLSVSKNKTPLPVRDNEFNAVILSGFSQELLKLVMNDTLHNPETLVEETISKYPVKVNDREAKMPTESPNYGAGVITPLYVK